MLLYIRITIVIITSTLALLGCASQSFTSTNQVQIQKITLGNLQKIIKTGATSSDVINALSSPNIITSNKDGSETWVYDKMYLESEAHTGIGSNKSVISTRTLIVVIKFDRNGLVENASYRQTSF